LPRLCGAVWHAAALSREVRGAVVSEWREQLGTEVFNLALQHRAWAGAANLLCGPSQLLAAIDRDGQACVADWFTAQPTLLQPWLQLRLTEFSTPPVEAGSAREEAARNGLTTTAHARLQLVRHLAAVLQATLDQSSPEAADVPA